MSVNKSAVDALAKALEVGLYYGPEQINYNNLGRLLDKLGIKSARVLVVSPGRLAHGAALQIEPLEGILKQVTFDAGSLKLWGKK